MHVVITGAGGNLGTKLSDALETAPWCSRVTGLDIVPGTNRGKLTRIVADLTDAFDARWHAPVAEADAIVHFSATDPLPFSSWTDNVGSIDMTMGLAARAGRDRPCRIVFASSNHVMGGYKEGDLPPDGKLRMTTPPRPGTAFFVPGEGYVKIPAYGASKLFGERAVAAAAAASAGRITGVSTRIGWCQSGENHPRTMHPYRHLQPGRPEGLSAEEEARDLAWFHHMWLSNRDFLSLMFAALTAPAEGWPGPAIVVNGVSANAGMAWDLEEAKRWIGYAPEDDSARALAEG